MRTFTGCRGSFDGALVGVLLITRSERLRGPLRSSGIIAGVCTEEIIALMRPALPALLLHALFAAFEGNVWNTDSSEDPPPGLSKTQLRRSFQEPPRALFDMSAVVPQDS